LRVALDLRKNSRPKAVLNNLFKHTFMQTTYPINMVALVNGIPQTLNLKQILVEFIKHRQKIITKRTLFDLQQAKKRAHILEGLKIALDNLDAVINTIKKSANVEIARINLIKKFSLTKIQAEAILEMQLRRLAALERKKIEEEYKEIGKLITYLTDLLANQKKILRIIKKELTELKKKFGDPRKTKIYKQDPRTFSDEDLVSSELCLITVTKSGYIKRLPVGTYHSQRRGGKGVTGMFTKEEDEIAQIFNANTHDHILFFTNKGRVFSVRAWEIIEGSRQSKGQAVVNLIKIGQEEKVQTILNLPSNFSDSEQKYLLITTKQGIVKKSSLRQFKNIRSSGLIAIKPKPGDELSWVKPTTGNSHVLLVSHEGKSIRFNEKDARPMGRDTMGVRGIRLKKDDYIVGMEVFPAKRKPPKDKRKKFFLDVLTIMEKGLGKRSSLRGYPIQRRGGIGVKAANVTPKTGKIIVSQLVDQKIDQVIITSKKAQVIKLPLKNVPILGRNTQGVILMRFSKPNDRVAAVTTLRK